MTNMNEDKKVDVLISALEERYKSTHKIRERVQTTGIWILGILTSVSGWLVQSDVILGCAEKQLYIFGLAIAFILIRFVYLKDLNKGFKGQQRTTAKLEKALGFYDTKFFNDDEDSLYSKSWEKAGTEEGEGKFFQSTYYLVYAGFIFLLVALLLTPTHVPHTVILFNPYF
jgi:heme/copper-type cytochrome/quinol oxidase subunit 4